MSLAKTLLFAIVMSGAIAACSESKSRSSSPTSTSGSTSPATSASTFPNSILTAADIEPTSNSETPGPLTLLEQLQGDNDFYHNMPGVTSSNNSAGSSACASVDNGPNTLIKATDTTMLISYSVDETACQNQDAKGSAYVSYTTQFLLEVNCPNGHLAQYNGQSLNSLPHIGVDTGSPETGIVNLGCPAGTILSEAKINFTSPSPASSTTGAQRTGTSTFYIGNRSLTACPFTVASNSFVYDNTCTSVQKTRVSDGASDYYALTFSNITDDSSSTSVWHTGGSIGVTNGDWTGTVTYSGAATPPTYTLSSPYQASPLTGSLTAITD